MSKVTQASYRVIVDARQVNVLLSELNVNNKDAKKAIKAALRKSAGIIRKEAQKNWVASVPGGKDLKKEINLAVYRNASGARVDLLDRRKKGSKQFILKFFDSGTKERATKKKKNRGTIKATFFFKDAVSSKKSDAESSLQQNIIDSIKKVANKKR